MPVAKAPARRSAYPVAVHEAISGGALLAHTNGDPVDGEILVHRLTALRERSVSCDHGQGDYCGGNDVRCCGCGQTLAS